MEYHGKLYGKLGAGRYFDTGVTSEQFDTMKAKYDLMEAAIKESLEDWDYLNLTPTVTIIKLRESVKWYENIKPKQDNQVNVQQHNQVNAPENSLVISSATLPLKEKIIEAINNNDFVIAHELLHHKQ